MKPPTILNDINLFNTSLIYLIYHIFQFKIIIFKFEFLFLISKCNFNINLEYSKCNTPNF